MAKQEHMTLIQFQKQFNTEEACHDHLFSMKWPNGYRCPRCDHDQCFETKTRRLTDFPNEKAHSFRCGLFRSENL